MRKIAYLLLCYVIFLPIMQLHAQDTIVTDHVIIGNIFISGNKNTREKLILRELTFTTGDTLSSLHIDNAFQRSRENLLNLSLFNYVVIEKIAVRNKIDIYVIVEERWYLWPSSFFDHADRNVSTLIHDKSWSKVDYGFGMKKNNFRGRGEDLNFLVTFGYNEKFAFSYSNIYLDRKRIHSISPSVSFLRNDAVDYVIKDNRVQSYKDPNGQIFESLKLSLGYFYRKYLYEKHTVYLDFKQNYVKDTVLSLNADFFGKNAQYLSLLYLTYIYSHDKRDRKYYPLKGTMLNVELRKYGFGFDNENGIDVLYVKSIYNKHWTMSDRWFFASGNSFVKTIYGRYPFFLGRGLGYGNKFIRGYEYYVIDGNDYYMSKNTLKYALLPTQITTIHFLPFSKFNKIHYAFYLNLSVDIGYVNAGDKLYKVRNNYMVNTLLYSASIGLDFVSYYDYVLSVAFAVNRYKESGIFLHINAPI